MTIRQMGMLVSSSLMLLSTEIQAAETKPIVKGEGNMGKVMHEAGKTWIPGVRKIDGSARVYEFECIMAVAEFQGVTLDNDEMMAKSGMAFRIHKLPRELFCPSNIVAGAGFRGIDKLIEYYPNISIKKDNCDSVVCRKIDMGTPVIAFGPWWLGIVAGYSRSHGQLSYLVRTFDDQTDAYTESNGPVTQYYDIGEFKETGRDQSLEILRMIPILATTPSFGEYHSGYLAYEDWASFLEGKAYDLKKQEDAHVQDGGLRALNTANYWALVNARTCASSYLRRMAKTLPTTTGSHIAKAADDYSDIVNELSKHEKAVPKNGNIDNNTAWTEQDRKTEAQAIRTALSIEKKAVSEIGLAIEQISKKK